MTEPRHGESNANRRREPPGLAWARRVNLGAILLTLAIVAAPFLALLYSLELALGVLAAALGLTGWLTLQVAGMTGPEHRSRLRIAAAAAGALTLATLAILLLRLAA